VVSIRFTERRGGAGVESLGIWVGLIMTQVSLCWGYASGELISPQPFTNYQIDDADYKFSSSSSIVFVSVLRRLAVWDKGCQYEDVVRWVGWKWRVG